MALALPVVTRRAAPLGRWGGVYTAHMRDEGDHILKAMDETFEIGRRVGAEIIVSHHKCSGRSNFGRMVETLPKFTDAMKQQQIAFDVYPYVAASTVLSVERVRVASKTLVTWSRSVEGVSGRDLITAVALGLDLGIYVALAQRAPLPDTLTFRASYALQHDSNLFRLPAGTDAQATFGGCFDLGAVVIEHDRCRGSRTRTTVAIKRDQREGIANGVAHFLGH